ncbi:C40 family peptidase [Janibacter indicus]|uniref:Cell wall-associated hydrolase, NlpC family n=1 Tax=Janibacter indicus TaxID=857417 RepID=A0A1W2BFY1_9MICO|nr:C40 family peptidase [Janibacter indicus]SMC71913.1 Cell wall-associated hydrolase, NlpC family [Janibacter indicus]
MSHNVGRHRAPERYNPLTEIGTVISQTGTPLAKGSAVLAASGGLVAAIAIPAQASTAADQVDATPVRAAAAPAAPAAAAVTAPSAPATSTAATSAFGKIEVEPVAKPTGPTPYQLRMRAEREQAAQERESEAASRSQERQSPAPQASTSTPAAETAAPAPAASSNVVEIAKQYIGTPYVYGGSTPAGFDCSGFTQYVFAKAGKSIPRVTTAQQAAATPVSSPQPGDLVFFGSPSWHVGIYVGDGMMIDSPRTGSSVSIRPIFDGVSGYGRV